MPAGPFNRGWHYGKANLLYFLSWHSLLGHLVLSVGTDNMTIEHMKISTSYKFLPKDTVVVVGHTSFYAKMDLAKFGVLY